MWNMSTVEWPFEDSVTTPARFQGWDKVLQEATYALSQHSIYDTDSPTARIHRCKNQEVEMGVASLTITLSCPLAKFLLHVLMTLYSVVLEALVSREGCFCQEIQQC